MLYGYGNRMNSLDIGPFTAFFLENILFCGYAVLAAFSAFAVHKLLVAEVTSQKQNRLPVYFQRSLINKSQQKISLLLFFLALANILIYQPLSYTFNSLLSHFGDFFLCLVGSDNWQNFIVFVILPLCTVNFLISIGTTVWIGRLSARLNRERIIDKVRYRNAVITVVIHWIAILVITAALLILMSYY